MTAGPVPKFAQATCVAGGRFAECDYAYRYTYPVPMFYGYDGWNFGGYGDGCFGNSAYFAPTRSGY